MQRIGHTGVHGSSFVLVLSSLLLLLSASVSGSGALGSGCMVAGFLVDVEV